MANRLVVSSQIWESLRQHLLADDDEHLAFILAGHAVTSDGQVLLAKELLPITDGELEDDSNSHGLSLRLGPLLEVMNRANREGLALVEAHSHPFSKHNVTFSSIDDQGQQEMASYLSDALPDRPYGALVLGRQAVDGAVWVDGAHQGPISEVRIIGASLIRIPTTSATKRKKDGNPGDTISNDNQTYHRQILAFGPEGQRKIRDTQVAIVGVGGIGSVVVQQLAHLGVQNFVVIDDDMVESTNLHRLVGSTTTDVGTRKVDVASHLIHSISEQADVRVIAENVRSHNALAAIKEADVVFGCVDTDAGRLILNESALAYLVPYIDCGVGIQAGPEGVSEAGGKVSVWTIDRPCLLCTRDLNPRIAAEELESDDERKFRQQHGYVADAHVPEPAVISLNSTVASLAVTEFLAVVAGVRPSHPYTYYDLMEGRVAQRIVKRDDSCVACAVQGLGDRADLDRYSRLGLPQDIPGTHQV